MANEANLKPFNRGYDSRRGRKPRGSKHLSTWIKELLNDEKFEANILDAKIGLIEYKGAPVKAVVTVAITQAINGEPKAREWLARYGYGLPDDKPEMPPNPIYFINEVPSVSPDPT
jgi:hypothetical protein